MPFERGVSGNPQGRPVLSDEEKLENEKIRRAFKKLSKRCLVMLRDDFINSPTCSRELRLKAIAVVLRHGFGNTAVLNELFEPPNDETLNVRIITRTKEEDEAL